MTGPRVRIESGNSTAPEPGEARPLRGLTRSAVARGDSFREVAERLGTYHSTVARAARREGWFIPADVEAAVEVTGAPHRGPVVAPSAPPTPSGQEDRPPAPQRPTVRPVVAGPPGDERSARVWHCRRCGLSGFDPNRGPAREWHTQAVCDAKVECLDAGFEEGGPGKHPAWRSGW